MGRWCQGIAHSCFVPDLLDCWVLCISLVSQRAYSPHCSILDDALCIVSECLRSTSTDNLLVLSGIQPAELHRQETTLSLANCSSLDPGHISLGQLTKPQAASKERLKSRHPFVPAARKLLHNLFKLGICAA